MLSDEVSVGSVSLLFVSIYMKTIDFFKHKMTCVLVYLLFVEEIPLKKQKQPGWQEMNK